MSKHSSGSLFNSTQLSWFWLVVRVYLGWQWLSAGYEKAVGGWFGADAGKAISGFFQGSLAKTGGPHPDVQAGYAWFITNVTLPNAHTFSYLIPVGEMAVGLALILGLLTGIAAFFGAVMNFNFMFAGSVSVNPYWVLMEIALMFAWKVAGYIGVDRYVLPYWMRMTRGK
jgi:thiosulfate dehydrogenase (quinone) large subunit